LSPVTEPVDPAAALAGPLAEVVAAAVGETVTLTGLRRLSGGTSRETWSFDAAAGGRRWPLVLRRDAPGVPSTTMALEARCLEAAARAGVPVPRVLAASDDVAALGASFLVMERIEGETIPRRILRDGAYAEARGRLAGQCAAAAAGIHSIDAAAFEGLADEDPLARWRRALDELGSPHPAFELAFRRLEANRPPRRRHTLVHGDFRVGNLIVGPEGLRAVLDWELAHVGDPLEDLGWFCVRAWRFGNDRLAAGGVDTYDTLVKTYEAASGTEVDRAALLWWETMGTLTWGILCGMQAARHTSGAVRSVELAAIGRRVCENEWDVLDCLERAGWLR
jgi:aminoglycoside phosphotransferase (APT) family kinase protein